MSKTTSILELNGKRYDAVTGKFLGSSTHTSIDGVSPGNAPVRHTTADSRLRHAQNADTAAHPHVLTTTKAFDIQTHPTRHLAHHKPQHAKTLMRHGVHRPETSLKRQVRAVTPTDLLVNTPRIEIVPKQSAASIDVTRLKHARHIHRSNFVTHFGAMPAGRPTVAATTARPLPYQLQQPAPPSRPAAIPVSKQPSSDVFERALATANSHKQAPATTKHPKKRHRVRQVTGLLASTLAIALIVGFVAYQNAAAIRLRIASSQAGINATLPAWEPAGFVVGSLTAGPGKVTVSFRSTQAPESFAIEQTASNWDSSTLLSDYVYPNNDTYNTIQTRGSTIYTYGNNNATWVNGGIWYKLTSDGTLSTSQIVRVATSM